MKTRSFAIVGAALVATIGMVLLVRARRSAAATRSLETTRNVDTPKKQLSYAIGVAVARSVQTEDLTLDTDVLATGVKDGFSGKELLMGEDALRQAMAAFDAGLKQKRAEATKAAAEGNRKEGEAFLAQNAKGEGVVTLPSGLQYKILGTGPGKRPTDDDTVECHYRGIRLDGKEFQSSYLRGQTATFPMATAIPGWQEALKLMPVGSKWKVFVPSQLAYGERGVPGKNGAGWTIGPNEAVIFEVELLAINTPRERTAAGKAQPTARED
jgi:FKBP-type peptidyl-prolyl cis-trans isomerase FklB